MILVTRERTAGDHAPRTTHILTTHQLTLTLQIAPATIQLPLFFLAP